EFIPAVRKGIVDTLKSGVIAGFPIVDVNVALYDGSFHEVDSSEHAFKAAASICFREAFRLGEPQLLEPIMAVEIVSPEEYMGNVNGDVSSRRGIIQSMEDSPSGKVIRCEVPLSEMFGYATSLRSATQGRANYSMEFKKYAAAPNNVAEAIIQNKR
ncbi:MAG: elongation factor G, partial [Gammaproteobacteria bacterium]|nr:elongation factor G [Gammaproteobacteria bacterium]